MGQYAEAAIWAEMNGMEFCDMGPEDWIAFYKEYDARENKKQKHHANNRCPKCSKRLKNAKGIKDHMRDVHGVI